MSIIQKIQSNPKYLKRVKMLSWVFLLLGMTGFLGGFAITGGFIEPEFELPLGHVTSIALDEDGNIYLGLEFYGYVQKYDKNGEFVKNWRVKSANGGAFNMRYAEGQIITSSARGDRVVSYDLDGNVLVVVEDADAYDWNNEHTIIKDEEGNIFAVEGWLVKRVAKTNGDTQNKENIITMDLLRSVLKGPLPAWLLAFIGIYLSSFSATPEKKGLFERKIERLFEKFGLPNTHRKS